MSADLAEAVALDDRLLDAIGSAVPGAAGSLVDDELNVLLLDFRRRVEAAPIPPLVDTTTAIDTIKEAAA